jgi:hypothetical protein
MSSPATGPYKSKLLNFLNRQSIQAKERLEQAGRHFKVAVEWGVQVLIYPVYLMVQTGRMAGRQLGKTIERSPLPPSNATEEPQTPTTTIAPETTIDRVLQAIPPLLSGVGETKNRDSAVQLQEVLIEIQQKRSRFDKAIEPASSHSILSASGESLPSTTSESSSALLVRGVASLIETQEIVLIAPNNEILDILSPEQQQKLEKRIALEVASYWYEWRLQQEAEIIYPELAPTFETEDDKVLPPAKLFWKAVRWMQTSRVAIAVNLFGESNLATRPQKMSTMVDIFPHREIAPTLTERLESRQKRSGRAVSTLKLEEIIQAAVDYFYTVRSPQKLSSTPYQTSQSLPSSATDSPHRLPQTHRDKPLAMLRPGEGLRQRDRFTNIVPKLSGKLDFFAKFTKKTKHSEPDPFQIQALIQAAIDYFFNQPQEDARLSKSNSSQISLSSSATQKLPAAETPATQAPWLSWDDLYTETETVNLSDRSQDARSTSLPPTPKKKPLKLKKPPVRRRLSPTVAPSPNLTNNEPSSLVQNQPTNSNLELDPDWIETPATPVGYVKHPLVRILEWLDRLILWLESAIATIWRWLRRH